MSAVPFTDRELRRAWQELTLAATPPSDTTRRAPHRLLLFYAVECGLKAVWLKRQNRTVFDRANIDEFGHDLRRVLKDLRVRSDLELPKDITLTPISIENKQIPRNGDAGILHQAWRYGGNSVSPNDQECERLLQQVLDWIRGELK